MTLSSRILVICVCQFALAAQETTPVVSSAYTSEGVLRKAVRIPVRPGYPADAIRQHLTGIVVVQVQFLRGRFSGVTPLESPSAAVTSAVLDAVSKWRFDFTPEERELPDFSGKLTFYYVFQDGGPRVLYPSEAPFFGWPPPWRHN